MKAPMHRPAVRRMVLLAAAGSLALCLAAPVPYLNGRWEDGKYKAVLLAGSIGWFLCAAALTATKSGNRPEP